MSVDKKFKKLDDIDHVILRPGMYIGSIKPHKATKWIVEDDKMVQKELTYNPGLLKIFDEIDIEIEKAVYVVKHDYEAKEGLKYLNTVQYSYPRKNWSSLMLWNCSHPKHQILTPDFIASQTGKYLHRFSWLDDEDIGELPIDWNWLAIEYPNNPKAKIIHYTLGTPCFKDYRNTDMAEIWHKIQKKILEGLE